MRFVKPLEIFLIVLSISYAYKLVPHSPEWYSKVQEFLETPEAEDDIEVPPVPENEVSYFLFTKDTWQNPINLTKENLDTISEDVDKLFFIIHGWLESREQQWYEDLKNALLDRYPNSNVIQVDYSGPAFDFYPKSMASAKYVGDIFGKFLVEIGEKRGISTKNMILLPHSLGSHVSGFAAKFVKQLLPTISRIIAMDPAGPRWDNKPCDKRLCKTDADVVVAVHTDAGGLGFKEPIGTIDFYANGGSNQYGCEESSETTSVDAACSHCRSWEYIIEAIKNPTHFISKKCVDWKTYERKEKVCEKKYITLGDLETKEEGLFYFKTHSRAPFAVENKDEKCSPGMASMLKSSVSLVFILFVLNQIKSFISEGELQMY